MLVTSIFSFSQNVFYPFKDNTYFLVNTKLVFEQRCSLKTLYEKEKMLITSIFSFSHNVFYPSKNKNPFFDHHLFCHLQMLSMYIGLKFCCLVYPFPNTPLFLCVCSTFLSKTLWEKEKLLVPSNFSFSPSPFYPF